MDYELEFGYSNITVLLLTFILTVADTSDIFIQLFVIIITIVHFLYYQYDYEPFLRKSRPRRCIEMTLFANAVTIGLLIFSIFLRPEYKEVAYNSTYISMTISLLATLRYIVLITYGRKRNTRRVC